MKVVLINSGNDITISGNVNLQSYPPLNIISLGTALKTEFNSIVDLHLIDGQIDSVECILNELKTISPDLVGVSIYCTSINNSIKIIRYAKNLGAKTILGNDHAMFHYANLLQQINELDYVCISDEGEFTLVSLLRYLIFKKIDLVDIHGLAYRNGNKIIKNENIRSSINKLNYFDRLPIPDRGLLQKRYWSYYLMSFKKQNHKSFDANNITGVTTINRARGCARFKNPCRYCGISDLSLRGSSGDIFWKDVRQGYYDVNANYFYEAFDSATSWIFLLKDWVKCKPKDLDTSFFMYSQANETTSKTVKLFKELGVKGINTGFDSGDDFAIHLLKSKRNSLASNKKAADLWTEANIEIHTSFVLAAIGDEKSTRASLESTVKFAEWLACNTMLVSMDSAVLYPDKGSIAGSWIWNPEIAIKESKKLGWSFLNYELLNKISKKWRNKVFIDPNELASDFADVCGVSISVLLEYDEEIKKIASGHKLNYGNSQGGRI